MNVVTFCWGATDGDEREKMLKDYCKGKGVTKNYMPDSFEHSRKKGGELSGVTKMIWKNTGGRKECTSTWEKKEIKLKNKKKDSLMIKYKIEVPEAMDRRQKRFIETLKMVSKIEEARGGKKDDGEPGWDKNQIKYKKTVIAEQDEFDEDIYWRHDKISQGFREETEKKKA